MSALRMGFYLEGVYRKIEVHLPDSGNFDLDLASARPKKDLQLQRYKKKAVTARDA